MAEIMYERADFSSSHETGADWILDNCEDSPPTGDLVSMFEFDQVAICGRNRGLAINNNDFSCRSIFYRL
jgi:hypothetical protein